MLLAVVTDLHLHNHRRLGGSSEAGINRRGRDGLDTLARAIGEANRLGCSVFLILGDLFDTTRPSPQLISKVQTVLHSAQQPIVVLGNHEMVSETLGDHALGPLLPIADVVEVPQIVSIGSENQSKFVLVPFRVGPADEWLPDVLEELSPPPGSILGLHLGIRDDATPFYLQNAHDSVASSLLSSLMERYELPLTIAGHWHDRKVWEVPAGKILQVGALCPTGWDNPDFEDYGFMAVWDTEEGSGKSIAIPGPRFVKVDSEEAFNRLVAEPPEEDRIYVEWTALSSDLSYANDRIRRARDADQIIDGCAVPDRIVEQEAARNAARAARSAETIEEALAAYIAEMTLEEGVSRKMVLARSKGYLVG